MDILQAASGCKFNPRFDGDTQQRVLFIWVSSWLIKIVLNSFPVCLGLWIEDSFLELWTSVILIGAVLKSCLQWPIYSKSVLITGCDSGFGFDLVKHLSQKNFVIFAGCLSLNSEGAETLKALGSDNVHVLKLDVTSEADWDAAVHQVKQHSDGLWAIVNNAGFANFGEVEWVSMDMYNIIMNVNVLGMIRGVKKCLPLIRKEKGRVVNIASGFSRMANPGRSSYVASKFAVQGFSDSLRYEMEPFGVKVCILEPGNFIAATKIFTEDVVENQSKDLWNGMSSEVKETYGEKHFQSRIEAMKKYHQSSSRTTEPVIAALSCALLDVFPQKRYYPNDRYFRLRNFVATHLPELFHDSLFVNYIKKSRTS